MAPGATSSPTSFLWAHQLKLEHRFLLDRMKKMESAISKTEDTAASVRKATAELDITAIAARVQSLGNDTLTEVVNSIREQVTDRLERVQGKMDALMVRVESLENSTAVLEENCRNTSRRERSVIEVVRELEENVKKHKTKLDEVADYVEEGSLRTIQEQFLGLADQVRSDCACINTVKSSLRALETETAKLKQGNEQLASQVKDLASHADLTNTIGFKESFVPQSSGKEALPSVPQQVELCDSRKSVQQGMIKMPKDQNTAESVSIRHKLDVERPASRRAARSLVKINKCKEESTYRVAQSDRAQGGIDCTPGDQDISSKELFVLQHRRCLNRSADRCRIVEEPLHRRGGPRIAKAVQSIEVNAPKNSKRGRHSSAEGIAPVASAAKECKAKPAEITQVTPLPPAPGTKCKAVVPDVKVPKLAQHSRSTRSRTFKKRALAKQEFPVPGTCSTPSTPQGKMKFRRGVRGISSSPLSSPPTDLEHVDVRSFLGLLPQNALSQHLAKRRRTIRQDDGEEQEALLRRYMRGEL